LQEEVAFFILIGLPPFHYWMYELALVRDLRAFLLLLRFIKLLPLLILVNLTPLSSRISFILVSILLCQLLPMFHLRVRFILLFSSLLTLNWILLVRTASTFNSYFLLALYNFLIWSLIPLFEETGWDWITWQSGFILFGLPPRPLFIMKLLFNLELLGLHLFFILILLFTFVLFYSFYLTLYSSFYFKEDINLHITFIRLSCNRITSGWDLINFLLLRSFFWT